MNKLQVMVKVEHLSTKNGSFSSRVSKSLKEGDFKGILSSQDLAHLLNEGPGKKIKANNLTALMQPLLKEDIIRVKIIGRGKNKRKYWFPGWIEKAEAEKNLTNAIQGDVMFFSGKEVWTDPNKNFPDFINRLKGSLRIVDPFYGNGTFYALEKFGKKREIKFLSAKLGDEEQKDITKFDNNLKRFRNEFHNIEMRKYDKFYELHDRYILADNALVVIGYGLKDLAYKESFVVCLSSKLVSKILPILKRTFDERWKISNNLK